MKFPVFGLLLMGMFGCQQGGEKNGEGPPASGPDTSGTYSQITGEWVNTLDSTVLLFDENKIFEVYLHNQAEPVYWGQYQLSGDTVRVLNAGASNICVNMEGFHRYKVEDSGLTFREVVDSCVDRRILFKTDWQKRG